jgi:hypothetical protein
MKEVFLLENTFKKDFDKFITGRAFLSAEVDAMHDPEHKKASGQANEIFHKIESYLPEEYRYLIFEYESLSSLCSAIALQSAYKLGLRDGIALQGELGLLNTCEREAAVTREVLA